MLLKPSLRFRFVNNREHFNPRPMNVIEYPNVADPEPVLGLRQASQPFDSGSARLLRLVSQVYLDSIANLHPKPGGQRFKVVHRLGRQNDLKRHSGQIIARISRLRKPIIENSAAIFRLREGLVKVVRDPLWPTNIRSAQFHYGATGLGARGSVSAVKDSRAKRT
jgi:hypothetical protein